MDDNPLGTEINSVEYWNNRFLEDWVAKGGRKQTEFFANLCCRELPGWFIEDVTGRKLSVFDYGCALGDALPVLQSTFSRSRISGGDASAVGVALARILYPRHEFIDLSEIEAASRIDDVVYCSNTLEHFKQWQEFLEGLAQRAKEYLLIVVPFEEDEPIDEHVSQFELDTLPPTLRTGLRLLHLGVVNAGAEPETHWNGLQLIAIYGRRRTGGSRKPVGVTPESRPTSLIFDLRQVTLEAVPALVRTFADLSRQTRRIAREREVLLGRLSAAEAAGELALRRHAEAESLLAAQLAEANARSASQLDEAKARFASELAEADARSASQLKAAEARSATWSEARLALKLGEADARFASGMIEAKAQFASELQEAEARSTIKLEEANVRFASQLEEAEQRYAALEDEYATAIAAIDRLTLQIGGQRRSYETAIWERDRARNRLAEEERLPAQSMPLVSIIMPVYNQADLVDEAIVGVLSQTYGQWELIIVDDGSTDDLADHVRQYHGDHRILFVRQPNLKLPAALNTGFRYSRGDLLMWTSADNVMLPRQVERLVEALAANPNAGLVYSDYWAIDDSGASLDDPGWRAHNRDPEIPALIRLPSTVTIDNFHFSGDNFIGASFMYRRVIADIVGRYAEDTFGGEDYDFWLRAHLVTEFHHLREPLYKYRVHDNTLTARRHILGLDANVSEVLAADRWRVETLLTRRSLHVGTSLLRDAKQFHPAILDHYRAVKYTDLALGSGAGEPGVPIVVDVDVPVRALDEEILQIADILLCRSDLAYEVLRRREGTHRQRVVRWHGDPDAATYHAFIQAFADRAAGPAVGEVAAVQPRIDEKFTPGAILMIIDSWSSGGLENAVVDLAQDLVRAGRSVFVGVADGLVPPPTLFSEYSGVRTLSFHGNEAELKDFLTQQPVDVINYHHCFFAASIARQCSVTCVYTMHNCYLWMDDKARHRIEMGLRKMDRVIAVSRQVAQFAVAQFNYPAEKIDVILNGLWGDALAPASERTWIPEEPFTVVMVASFTRLKLQHVAIAAFAQLAEEVPELRLRLVGMPLDQPYFSELTTQIAGLSCRDRIEIIPGLTRTLVIEELKSAQIYLLPSALEGCSLALIEAVAAGCVCISTDVGAARDLQIEGGSVLIIPSPLGELDNVNQREFYEAIATPLSEHQENLVAALRRVRQEYASFVAGISRTRTHLWRLCNMPRVTEKYLQAYTFAIRGSRSLARDFLDE